ncbi:MAG: RES family NAD+ phosphorylase [Alphaproteobacteria bacterium]|nr:RES family NAD+ phosphorylase [Alphaproteobacteria bacterium]
MTPPKLAHITQATRRLIASRWPTIGVFDRVSVPADIQAAYELEMMTNDRLRVPLERLHELPESEWVVGIPHANIVMAAWLHADEQGGRFTDGTLGCWYCSFDLQTAIVETVYHHTRRLSHSAARYYQTIQMRELRADVDDEFHDLRGMRKELPALYSPSSYAQSQPYGVALRKSGSNGLCFDSVRYDGGVNLAVFHPRLVLNVTQGDHFQYEWIGKETPVVSQLTNVPI